ncbi:hypothetical protein [Streptomyces sp. NPDC001675]
MSKERKKRRRFVAAAITANSMGAAAGLATQLLISDPTTSVLVGTVVSGTVGDILLQVAQGPSEEPSRQRELTDATKPSGASDGGPHAGHRGRDRRSAHRDLHLRVQSARAAHGYTRCGILARRAEAAAAPGQANNRSSQALGDRLARVPLHPRHRQLHRAAQRRVRTQHGPRMAGDGHGAS